MKLYSCFSSVHSVRCVRASKCKDAANRTDMSEKQCAAVRTQRSAISEPPHRGPATLLPTAASHGQVPSTTCCPPTTRSVLSRFSPSLLYNKYTFHRGL